MVTVTRSESGCSIGTPDFRLDFQWVADRCVHSLAHAGSGGFVTVAQSFESDPDRDDPRRVISPTYQQMEIQEGPEGPGALLLGQFGPHHFSAVFSMRESPEGITVEVDVADRCRAPMDALACTYTVLLPTGDLREAGAERVSWDPAEAFGARLQFERLGLTRVVMAEGGRQGIRVQADAKLDPKLATQRCLYRWRWSRSDGSGRSMVPASAP